MDCLDLRYFLYSKIWCELSLMDSIICFRGQGLQFRQRGLTIYVSLLTFALFIEGLRSLGFVQLVSGSSYLSMSMLVTFFRSHFFCSIFNLLIF